uniref:DH domain-containing protein n=1 Tax=Pelusios castaneus TaxID=367368 RepID=A0A8C8SH94_9SAUR
MSQQSLFEVLTSEASYQRSLCLLADHFVSSQELAETLAPRERQALFSSVLRIKEVSARFLAALEQRVAEDLLIRDVSDVVATHARRQFTAYVDYVRNQPYQEQAFSALMENNAPFAAVLARLQAHPCCQRLPLLSFLLLPFQRITRIKMLLEVGTQASGTACTPLGFFLCSPHPVRGPVSAVGLVLPSWPAAREAGGTGRSGAPWVSLWHQAPDGAHLPLPLQRSPPHHPAKKVWGGWNWGGTSHNGGWRLSQD